MLFTYHTNQPNGYTKVDYIDIYIIPYVSSSHLSFIFMYHVFSTSVENGRKWHQEIHTKRPGGGSNSSSPKDN